MTPTPHSTAITRHDGWPAAAAERIDHGLGAFNDQAAPLHEVRPVSCFVRTAQGEVMGGVLGRLWGPACELQQLWVDPLHRGQGHGVGLVREFERMAAERGARTVWLETFSFQAPRFYSALGYETVFDRDDYPHGIVKHHLRKRLDGGPR